MSNADETRLVLRRHNFRLYPTARQDRILRAWAAACVLVWNSALEQRERFYREYVAVETTEGWQLRYRPSHGIRAGAPIPEGHTRRRGSKRPDGVSLDSGRRGGGLWVPGLPRRTPILGPDGSRVENQSRQLAQARASLPEIAAVPASVLNRVLYDLDAAYQHMFRRAKEGAKLGPPRYKSSRRHVRISFGSIGQTHTLLAVGSDERTHAVILQSARGADSIGALRARSDLPLAHRDLGELSIREEAGRWHASIVLRDVVPRPAGAAEGVVALNRGVVHFATLNTGERLEGFPGDPQIEAQLLTRRRAIARKWRTNNADNLGADGRLLPGRQAVRSRREAEDQRRVARLMATLARKRHDELHLIANDLLDRYHTILIEDLEIQRMVRSPREAAQEPRSDMRRRNVLNRRVHEKAWGEFARILEYKAAERGNIVRRVDPKYISRQCPECGALREENPSRRTRLFCCLACGHSEDVDVVAARNVLMRGLGELGAASTPVRSKLPGALATARAHGVY